MKKFRIGFLVAALCLFSLALTGCGGNLAEKGGRYEKYDSSYFTVGEQSYAPESVTSVDIEWVGGSVEVVFSASARTVTVSEVNSSADQDLAMRCGVRAGKLSVHFAASRASIPAGFSKSLKLTVPQSVQLADLEAETVAADLQLINVRANEVTAETLSGKISLSGIVSPEIVCNSDSGPVFVSGCGFTEAEIETKSGNVELGLSETGFTCEYKTSGGKLTDEFNATKNGRIYTYGNGFMKIEVETSSGNLALKKI